MKSVESYCGKMVRSILAKARKEAAFLQQPVGPEHILLGICGESFCGAARLILQWMKGSSRSFERVRQEVHRLLPLYQMMPASAKRSLEAVPLTSSAKLVLERALEEARRYNSSRIQSEHLLLALLEPVGGVARIALLNLGIVREDIERSLWEGDSEMAKRHGNGRVAVGSEGGEARGGGFVVEGARLGEYVLESRIGEGGFGEVWRGRHYFLREKVVAVKVYKAGVGEEVLEREAMVQFKLGELLRKRGLGGGIVEFYGMDVESRPPYLVMEYVEGVSLRHYLEERKRLTFEEVLRVFTELLEIVSVAHEAGIVHGDLKPENILLASPRLEELRYIDRELTRLEQELEFTSLEGGDAWAQVLQERMALLQRSRRSALGRVKIADFGLSSRCVEVESLHHSFAHSTARGEGIVGGTQLYMAPELRQGEGKGLQPQSDVYSLGVILYEMLVGEPPQGVDLPTQWREDIPKKLDEVYQRCCTHVQRRFSDAGELFKVWRSLWRGGKVGGVEKVQEGFTDEKKKVQKSSPPVPKINRKSENAHIYGGFARRFMAMSVDCILLIIFLALAIHDLEVSDDFLFGFSFYTGALYFILTTSMLGGTIGKRMFGLKVLDKEGRHLGFFASACRYLGYWLSLVLWGMGFLMIAFHPKKRGLHDWLAGSVVVDEDEYDLWK
ncbi:MAG: hypothetical protein D6805_06705 [Planctomycetota bacterium]|nr:MAG: hypothetical protein D6805_06705 [Planctomycetota bacterium]